VWSTRATAFSARKPALRALDLRSGLHGEQIGELPLGVLREAVRPGREEADSAVQAPVAKALLLGRSVRA
jgi:hypothetical protein